MWSVQDAGSRDTLSVQGWTITESFTPRIIYGFARSESLTHPVDSVAISRAVQNERHRHLTISYQVSTKEFRTLLAAVHYTWVAPNKIVINVPKCG